MSFFGQPVQDGSFNIGTEKKVRLVRNDTGAVVPVINLSEFEANPEVQRIKIETIDSKTDKFRTMYPSWKGTITFERANGDLERLQAELENRYANDLPELLFSIYEETTNPDGTVDEFLFQKVRLNLESTGVWKKNSSIPIKVAFDAERRVEV